MTSTRVNPNAPAPGKLAKEAAQAALQKAGQAGNLAKKGIRWSLYHTAMTPFAWTYPGFWNLPGYVKFAVVTGSGSAAIWALAFCLGFVSGKPLPSPRNIFEATNPAAITHQLGSGGRNWANGKAKTINDNAVEWNKRVVGNEK